MFDVAEWTHSEALAVTGIDAATLQNWVNRGRLALSEQNPGRGRRRLYTACDIVQIAILSRFQAFGIDVRVGSLLAEEAARTLALKGEIEWQTLIPIRRATLRTMAHSEATISSPPFYSWAADRRDAGEITVREFIEGTDLVLIEATENVDPWGLPIKSRRMRRVDGTGPIVPEVRDKLARQGRHAEPILVFPLGEVVNGTLLRLDEMRRGELQEI